MRCIAVINQKGGVGKTTSTVNIGGALARRGNKVLLLDIDPQANLTLHLDCQPEGDGGTMTDLLVDGKAISAMISGTTTEGLYMVPADTSLSGVETMLANRIGRETILREAIEALDEDEAAPDFDYIFLDCPPSLGVLAANALVSADEIIIPMQAEYFSMQGMTKLMEVMQLVKQRLNPALSICLILPCMVDRRTNLTNEVLTELRQHFGDVLAETCIRSNVKLAEAPSFGRTIFEHAPESNGARDYDVVADELLRRFAGTFEAAPLESELEEEEEEDLIDAATETEDASEVVEPVAADEVAETTQAPPETATVETPADQSAVEEPADLLATPEDGAPFVESVPPSETDTVETSPIETDTVEADTPEADTPEADNETEPACTTLVVVPETLPLVATPAPIIESAEPPPTESPSTEDAVTDAKLPQEETAPSLGASESPDIPPETTNGSPAPAAEPTIEVAPAPVGETPDANAEIETATPGVPGAAERQEGSGA